MFSCPLKPPDPWTGIDLFISKELSWTDCKREWCESVCISLQFAFTAHFTDGMQMCICTLGSLPRQPQHLNLEHQPVSFPVSFNSYSTCLGDIASGMVCSPSIPGTHPELPVFPAHPATFSTQWLTLPKKSEAERLALSLRGWEVYHRGGRACGFQKSMPFEFSSLCLLLVNMM